MDVTLIRFSSLGDCILLCPLAAHLARAGMRVTVVTKRPFVDIFAAATGVDRILALGAGAGLRDLGQIARALNGRADIVIDAHNNWRSRALCAMLGGASIRIEKHYRERVGLIVFKRPAQIPSILEQYGQLAVIAGAPAALSPGDINIPQEARERCAERLGSDARENIAVAPGSRWPMKRWPVERYLDLSERLCAERDCRIILVGDRTDGDLCRAFADRLGNSLLDMTGCTTILETAACISGCRGFVGNDSGLMHLAEALGVPVVGIFGPTVREFGYYPALESSRTVERRLACRPCSRNGKVPCPRGTHECMTGISTDEVQSVVTNLLEQTGTRRVVLE